MKVNIDTIYPNELNDEIYQNTDLTDLIQSLQRNGQLEPIVVMRQKGKMTIVSGHRRYFALKQLGVKEVEIRIDKFDNPIIALIEFNRYRQKTATDILREGRYLEQEYRKKMGGGKGTRTDLKKTKSFDTLQKVAQDIGIGTSNYKKLKAIHRLSPDLLEAIEQKKTTITTAYKMVQKRYMKRNKNITKDDRTDYKIRSLINDLKPSEDVLVSSLKKLYPYNLIHFDTSKLDEYKDKRDELIDNLKKIKSLDEQEVVRYRKLKEIQSMKYDKKLAKKLKGEIFQFSSRTNKQQTIKEIESIEPILSTPTTEEFNIIRTFISSFEYVAPLGRVLKYVVRNKSDNKILGLLTLSSDVVQITPREDYIGWTEDDKWKKKKMGNICIANTIVATQPFGFNALGGKLIAGLIALPQIREDWKKKYKDELVGITTTSLYGGFSMYNSHLLFKKIGKTYGSLLLKPDDEHWKYWTSWLKKVDKKKYDDLMAKSSPKQKLMSYIYSRLNVDTSEFMIEQPKGVYFMELYHNTKEFLRDEIHAKDLEPNMKYTQLMDWWKKKAVKRYLDLHKKKAVSNQTLWYENFKEDEFLDYLNVKGLTEY